jgi:hypothetical protein
MGWYKTVISKTQSAYEAKIVKVDAERLARKRLFYKGNASPTQDYLNKVVSDVVKTLEAKYGSLDKIRLASNTEDLSALIEKAVIEVLP